MPVIKTKKADLKARYGVSLKLAFILSLSLIIVSFKFFPSVREIENLTDSIQDVIVIEDIVKTVQNRNPPPPPPHPDPLSNPDENPSEPVYKNNEIDEREPVLPPPLPRDRPIINDEEIPFTFSEVMPEPIGGIAAIQKKIKYTAIALKAEIEGTVYIQVTITKEGNPIDAVILKSLGGGLDEEALMAVLNTKFNPGLQRDKPVNVRIVIPIKFKLK